MGTATKMRTKDGDNSAFLSGFRGTDVCADAVHGVLAGAVRAATSLWARILLLCCAICSYAVLELLATMVGDH